MKEDIRYPVYPIDGLKGCCNGNIRNRDRVIKYLKMARKEFQTALAVIGDDIMWNSFIRYNDARVSLLESCLLNSGATAKTVFDDSIEWRYRQGIFLDDVFGDHELDSDIQFFKNAFKAEELMVRLQKISAFFAVGAKVDPDEVKPVLAEVEKAIDERRDFGRLTWRYNDIVEYFWPGYHSGS